MCVQRISCGLRGVEYFPRVRRKRIKKELNILPPKPCIFCGAKSGSLEDIIARWILKTAEIEGKKIVIGFGIWLDGKQDTVTEERTIEDMLLPSVCGSCNNTWMSRLENLTKSTLGELLRPQYPTDDRALIARLEKQKNLLALWAMKTACTFGEKMSVAVPRDFVTDLRNLILPAGLKLELAYSEMPALVMHMTNHCRLLDTATSAQEMKNDASFVLVLQINHLLIRLSYCPFTVRLQTNHRNPIDVYPSFIIPPDFEIQKASLILRHRGYAFDDFNQFRAGIAHQRIPVVSIRRDDGKGIVPPW